MKRVLIVFALSLTAVGFGTQLLGAGARAEASDRVSECGRLVEFVGPASDPPAGLGRVRLVGANGERTILFHHTNASNTPSVTERNSTEPGANVCFSGPVVHSASPVRSDYVSPYELRHAPLPNTSTSPTPDSQPTSLIVLLAASALAALHWRWLTGDAPHR